MKKDWYSLWLSQTKFFVDAAEKHLNGLFAEKTTADQQEALFQNWLNLIKEQWQTHCCSNEHGIPDTYLLQINKIFNDATEKLSKIWTDRIAENNPVRSIRELYEIWLSCCQEVYENTLQTTAFQNAFRDLMHNAWQFWQNYLPQTK